MSAAGTAETVIARLDELAAIGWRLGANRPGLSAEEQAAHDLVAGWMRDAGLEVEVAAGGTLVGRRRGLDPSLPEVWTGSHLDTVPDGGRFDGALGVVGGLAAVELLGDRPLPRTLAVVAFRDEEGWRFGHGLFGSRALTGGLREHELDDADRDGVTVRQALAALGLPEPGDTSTLPPLRAFVELHVEQGPVLAAAGAPLGVVSGVVGIAGLGVTFRGRRGHAGTVPLDERADAARAAARFVLALGDRARAIERAVATIGSIEIPDGASNVVAGLVRLSVDVRAPDCDGVETLVAAVREEAAAAAAAEDCVAGVTPRWREEPVTFDAGVRRALADAAAEAGVQPPELPSGAGHDAAVLAAAGVPTAMLFTRSLAGGVSHVPEEETDAEAIGLAVETLSRALARLAGEGAT